MLAVARADPGRAWKTGMCQTFNVILCFLPPFWWAMPFLCCISCCEAGDAKQRARSATIILTDKCIYIEGDSNTLLSRIPLDELGNITTIPQDTCLNASDPDNQILQIFTRGNASPVYMLACVKNPQTFINKALEAQTSFLRSSGPDAVTVMQPQASQQPGPVGFSPDNPYIPRDHAPQAIPQQQQQQQQQQLGSSSAATAPPPYDAVTGV